MNVCWLLLFVVGGWLTWITEAASAKGFGAKKEKSFGDAADFINQSRSLMEESDQGIDMTIYLSWYLPFNRFQYVNYKAFESLLVLYSLAEFHVRVVCHRALEFNDVGSNLPLTAFLKYARQGFNVQAHAVYYPNIDNSNSNMRLREYARTVNEQHEAMGASYFSYYLPEIQKVTDQSHGAKPKPGLKFVNYKPAPFHLMFYDALVALYHTGGIFTDFTWIFTKRLDHPNPPTSLSRKEESHSENRYAGFDMKINCNGLMCFNSVTMKFSRMHPVIKCMATLYGKETFQRCLSVDSLGQGGFCVHQGMQSCFNHLGVLNELQDGTDPQQQQRQQQFCFRRELSEYANSTLSASIEKVCRDVYPKERDAELMIGDASKFDHSGRIWMGDVGSTPRWQVPSEQSYLSRLIASNNVQLAREYQRRVNDRIVRNKDGVVDVPTCARAKMLDSDPLGARQRANMTCAVSFVMPGFMKAGSTYLFNMIDDHPSLVRPLKGFNYKEPGCYTTQLLTNNKGKEKFQRLHCYPLVEPHDIAAYGDGSIIMAHQHSVPQQLYADNPDIKVVFALRNPVDRTLSHHHYDYPNMKDIRMSNINDCIDFFMNNVSESKQWHDMAVKALHASTRIEKDSLRMNLTNVFYKSVMNLYGRGDKVARCSKIFFDSVYFPQIYYWDNAIPIRNIRVINMEKLQESKYSKLKVDQETPVLIEQSDFSDLFANKQSIHRKLLEKRRKMKKPRRSDRSGKKVNLQFLLREFNAIFKFLGLPEVSSIRNAAAHETKTKIPSDHLVTPESRDLLEKYFEPLNSLFVEYMEEVSRRRFSAG